VHRHFVLPLMAKDVVKMSMGTDMPGFLGCGRSSTAIRNPDNRRNCYSRKERPFRGQLPKQRPDDAAIRSLEPSGAPNNMRGVSHG
jgi:hypothetical protein